jgi:hypothetical protein
MRHRPQYPCPFGQFTRFFDDPFGSLAEALEVPEGDDPAAELESITREPFTLEEQTSVAADMIERSARDLPELAGLLNSGMRAPVVAALAGYLAGSPANLADVPSSRAVPP